MRVRVVMDDATFALHPVRRERTPTFTAEDGTPQQVRVFLSSDGVFRAIFTVIGE